MSIPCSPAAPRKRPGFKPGDLVLTINGEKIESFSEMQRIVSISAGAPLTVEVERDNAQVTLKAVPQLKELKDNFGNVHRLGVLGISRSMAPGDIKTEKAPPLRAIVMGAQETWFVVDRTLSYISWRVYRSGGGRPARRADQDRAGIRAGGAPRGFAPLIHLRRCLSVSIGLLNLFPIPLLDGGHLLFYAIETIRGRPLSERAQELGFRIGLAIVLMLMIFATFNDILHLATS